MAMSRNTRDQASGFTVLEISIVVMLVGALLAIVGPRITNAMREYRLDMAMRQFADLVQRVKTQAVSDNLRSGLAIDSGNRRFGLVHYLPDGTTVDRIDYVPMPQGISFALPDNITAPVMGAPTGAAVSFPRYGTSTTVFVQNFSSRGFPIVNAGAINAVYMTNGKTFRAVTVNSVSGVRKWSWLMAHDTGQWTDTR